MNTTRFSHTKLHRALLILLVLLLGLLVPIAAQAQTGQVQVVLFYSPFCGHCQKVISEDLPPIVQSYNASYSWRYFGDPPDEEAGTMPPVVAFEGDVFQILYVDTTTQLGSELYQAMAERFQLAPEKQVVPIMVVGEELLIGGVDIPGRLPGLIDDWISAGGLPWPDIPGLGEPIAALVPFPDQVQESPMPETGETQIDPGTPGASQDQADPSPEFEKDLSKLSVLERIQLDPLGNSLSIAVLIGMLFSLAGAGMRWRLPGLPQGSKSFSSIIPVLILAGALVAGYLSFVETTGAEAVCGPVGDCSSVQASEYARLFGILPVGFLGFAGYLGMLGAWWVARQAPPPSSNAASLALFGIALLGTVFSLYLTFLEPFVIGATCMWCLSSAVIITLIMLLSTDPARMAYANWRARQA